MKEFFVKGTVAWTTSYVADGEKKSKESKAEFDRFVKAKSAETAKKDVTDRVIEQRSRRSAFGTKSNVRITEIAVYERVA